MASEQGDRASLPGGIEEWLADHTAEIDGDRDDVVARALVSYRLLTENGDEKLDSRLEEIESRLHAVETATADDRLDELEAELDGHVEDLRSRIVDVVKEARSRAPANHEHTALEDRLASLETTTDTLESTTDSVGADLETTAETVETLESKADRLAGAVVDIRRRVERIERHVSHETALAELLETAARNGVETARCGNCNEEVRLSMLVEPACPHCRSVFEDVEPGSLFFKPATLTVADRPALEAGETTDRPFASDTESQPTDGTPE